MTAPLTKDTIEIIKATVPVLEKHGNDVTKRFYEMMLSEEPELNNVFNQTNQKVGDQPKALANTVYAAAANIENLASILPVVEQIAHKHKSLNIQPEQYPIVGKYLLLAMKDVLGDAATDEVIDAWGKAYNVIADVFIQVEKKMYEEDIQRKGGWNGFREFVIDKKIKESEVITSFYLKPADGKPVMDYLPGQYISVKAEIPGAKYTHLRQYSLSTAPGTDVYRISVKKEKAQGDYADGVVSNFLHEQVEEGDTIKLSAPAGDFYLDTEDSRPLVLMSRGVGLTPLMSMLETAISVQPERDVYFLYATYSTNYHAMKDRMFEIQKEHPQVHLHTVYNDPQKEDEGKFDTKGYIDEDLIKNVIPTTDAAFYFCGPDKFMNTVAKGLENLGVKDEDIHYEYFGPQLAKI